MELSNSEYRRRVFMTFSQKPAKASLRRMASSTKLVNIAHAVTGIATEVGETIKGMLPYLTGASQMREEFKQSACEEMGDTLYYVFVLAKTLKVKTPRLTKKVKLKGFTLTEGILILSVLSTDMLDIVKKNYYGLESKTIDVPEGLQKVYVPQEGGGGFNIVEKVVPAHQEVVFDKEAQDAKNEQRAAVLAALLAEFIEMFWPVCFALFGKPPHFLASGNAAKLAERYPSGFFDKAAQEDRDEARELDAMSKAASA
jgi:hypothetical protein